MCMLVCGSRIVQLGTGGGQMDAIAHCFYSLFECVRLSECLSVIITLTLISPKAAWNALNLFCVYLCVRVCARREEQDCRAGGCEVSSVCPSVTL